MLLILSALACFTGVSGNVNMAALLPKDYDFTVPPLPKGGKPITVGISWNIKGIFDINFHDMTVLLAMYFRMRWDEHRLIPPPGAGGEGYVVPIHSSILKKMWLPDLYVHEAVNIKSFSMIENLQGVFLEDNHTIVFSSLFQTRLACPMFFSRYPFDVQNCPMSVSSYNFGEDKLLLEWMSLGVSAGEEVNSQVPNYNFVIRSSDISSKSWCKKDVNCSFAAASIGKAQLVFERRYIGHMLTLYLPSALVVSLAWVSFFWPPDAVPGRTVLIITSLLTIISMYATVGQRSPETSYLKAVDVWLFLCILHVVLALFQYAVILTIKRKQKERTVGHIFPKSSMSQRLPPIGGVHGGSNNHNPTNSSTSSPQMSTDNNSQPASAYKTGVDANSTLRLALHEQWVEQAGRIGLPILFFLCCLVYWPCYLS